jgi:mono/diheme cytochrome c family protein
MALSRLALGAGLAAAILAAAAGPASAAPNAARGEELVRRHCGGCHAVGTTGDSHEPAAPRFRELNRRYPPSALQEALAEGLLTGHPLMPEFRFEPDDVTSIILYLDLIQTRQTSARGAAGR